MAEKKSTSETSVETLKKILKPELFKAYEDWYETANDREKKGLKLLSAIYKHKGMKKFRAEPPSVLLEALKTQETLDLQKAEEMYRKNQITSFYTSEFGGLANKTSPETNIFKFKKCSELEFTNFLNKLAVQFIDNWLETKDELEFQELVLVTLRSLNSRYKSIQVRSTETKQQYQWNVDWDLCKPIRVDKIGADLKTYKADQNNVFKQRIKQEELKEKYGVGDRAEETKPSK